MMPIEESDQKASVQRIKQKIDKLTDAQSQALPLAIYVGMSRDDARKYDERLGRIKKLVAELACLL